MQRGEVYFADLSPGVGSEQGGIRQVLILQNDIGNRFSPTVIVAAITLGELTVPDRPGAISRSAGSRSVGFRNVDRPGSGRLGAGGDEAGDRLLCVGLTGGDGRDDRVGRDRTDLVDQAFEQTVAGLDRKSVV